MSRVRPRSVGRAWCVRGARAPDTNNSGSGSVIFDEICNFKELDILKYGHADHDIQNPVRVATQEDLKLLASAAMLRENHPGCQNLKITNHLQFAHFGSARNR